MKLLRFLFIVLLFSCTKEEEAVEPQKLENPVKAELEYPFINSRCTEGNAAEEGKTEITFQWEKGENTTNQELMVKNLHTQETVKFFPADDSHTTLLNTSTPYSWYVIGYNKGVPDGVMSDIWKFYTSGNGVTNYAPFPADLLLPENNAEVSASQLRIRLEWEGSDVDGENLKYDLYFGNEAENMNLYRQNLTTSFVEAVVAEGKAYFWKIVSRDPAGNTSESDIRYFTTSKAEEPSGGSSAKLITSFSITYDGEVYEAVINEATKTIHLELDNFDYRKLAPEIKTSIAATVVPANGTEQNFLDNLYYKVIAEDGTETVYNVDVLSGQHEILNFEVQQNGERYIGIIDHENATVTIELGGNDFSNLKPIIKTSDNSSIDPPQGAVRNFNRDVMYTVTSEKGTTKAFKVIAPLRHKSVFPFFGAGGYQFNPETENERFIMYPGADLNFEIANVPEPENLIIELVNTQGTYRMEIKRFDYYYDNYMEISHSAHIFKTIIPYGVPSGTYNYRLRDGIKTTLQEHEIEIINDETTIKITGLNAEEYGIGDRMIITGENLVEQFTVYSNFSNYIFANYYNEMDLTEDRRQLSMDFTQNVYGNLSTGEEIKPMVVYTTIPGYEHKVVSNTVYFRLKRYY